MTDDWPTEEGVTCVSCPDCAYTFDAGHTDRDGGYSCPCCEEAMLLSVLGDALTHIRLAFVAGALVADGFSVDEDEPHRILTLLCDRLVAAGAVDEMEAAAVGGLQYQNQPEIS